MQKYRIVPSQDNMFWQLIQGMRLTDEQKELLKACTIRHVEVSPHTSTWEIALTSQLLIADDLLQEAARQIEKKCQLKKVIFYQDVVNVEDAVSKIWPKLVYETAEGNPTVYELLKRSKYTVDGSHILIDVPGELGGEIMRAHAVTHVMGQIVERMLGYRCRIECNASEEVLQNLEVDDCFNTREYREAVRKERAHSAQGKEAAAPQTAAAATAATAAKKAAPAAKKTAAKSHRRDARGPVVIQSAGSLVLAAASWARAGRSTSSRAR